jgi:hypothetical protein
VTDRAAGRVAGLGIRCLACLVLVTYGSAQTIEIAPVAASRGFANIFRMVLKPKADQPLTALQWEFIYPNSLRIEPAGVVTSGAVEASGKLVTCAVRPPRESNQVLTCILAGGVKPLAEGTIVIVRFVASSEAARGVMNLRLEKVAAAFQSSERVSLENVKVPITVR